MKRTRIISSIMVCIMCLSFLVVGVWAVATSVLFNLNGNLKYYPEGVYVELSGQVYRGSSEADLKPLKSVDSSTNYTLEPITNFDNSTGEPSGNFPMESWDIGSLPFAPQQRYIKVEVTITNYSEFEITSTPEISIGGSKIDISTYTNENFTMLDNASNISNISSGATTSYILTIALTESATQLDLSLSVGFEFEEKLPYTIEQENIGGKDYTFVYFGNYPQTYVGDELNTTLKNAFDANSSALTATGKTYTTYDGVKITADNLICKEYEINHFRKRDIARNSGNRL